MEKIMTMSSSRPYIARALYDWILDNDCTPYILVDASQKGVEVPKEYVQDGQIVLNISPSAVRALHMGDDVVIFDGRFGGEALTIVVPLHALMAIYARENGQGMFFEVEFYNENEETAPAPAPAPAPLESVPSAPRSSNTKGDNSSRSGKPPKKPGKPSLKVIK